jgi:hypothetical protein
VAGTAAPPPGWQLMGGGRGWGTTASLVDMNGLSAVSRCCLLPPSAIVKASRGRGNDRKANMTRIRDPDYCYDEQIAYSSSLLHPSNA